MYIMCYAPNKIASSKDMALQMYHNAFKNAHIHRIFMTKFSGDRKGSVQEVRTWSPAEQFAPLATTFGRRLLLGVGAASLVAIAAIFGGITSFLLGLSPENGRGLKLDVLYDPIGGYSRCIDTNEGFG